MSIHLGDLPTWLASLGTIAAFGAALWQIGNERGRRLAQEQRDRVERHQAQARLVASWIGEIQFPSPESQNDDGRTAIELLNGSAEPIYEIVTSLVYIQGAAPSSIEAWYGMLKSAQDGDMQVSLPAATLSILPPGRWRIWVPGHAWGIMSGRLGAEVAFTDRAGAHWIRRAKGGLEELPKQPFKYFQEFGMYGPPYDYQMPTPTE